MTANDFEDEVIIDTLASETIVSLELMIETAKQFFHTKEQPLCIEWFEL